MQEAGAGRFVTRRGNWIGGKEQAAASGASFPSYDPTTGEVWGEFALADGSDVDGAVGAAKAAFAKWKAISPTRRGRLLMRWADAIHANADTIGRIETSQNGKLLNEMVLQPRIVPDWLYYYGGLADKIEGRVIPLDRHLGAQLHAARAARRGRRDHAVELAPVPHHHGGRPGAGCRQHGRDQAVGGDARFGDRGRAAR